MLNPTNNFEKTSYLSDDSLSVIDDLNSTSRQYHYCYKIVVTLDTDFQCVIDGEVLAGLKGLIVNHRVLHSLFAPDTNVLIIFIKSQSLLGWKFRGLLGQRPCMSLDEILTRDQFDHILPGNYPELANRDLIPSVNAFLHSLLVASNLMGRSLFVHEPQDPLSDDRIWQRIRDILAVTVANESIFEEACLRFGFKDPQHFAKVFKRIFDCSPTYLIRHCRILV